MLPFNAVTATRHGLVCYHRLDQYVGQSLDRYGEFSAIETGFLCALIGPGSTVIDGGANLGALTLPLAKRVGQYGQVYAIEPQRLTFQALCGTLALNSIPNVVALNVALGRTASSLTIPELDLTQPQNVGGLNIQGHEHGRPVPVLPIDALGLTSCSLIKLDLEGMERDAIAGAQTLIRKTQPILYVEADRAEQRDGLIADLKALGYRLWYHKPPLYNPGNWRGVRENIFGDLVSLNIFAVPGHDPRTDFDDPSLGLEAIR